MPFVPVQIMNFKKQSNYRATLLEYLIFIHQLVEYSSDLKIEKAIPQFIWFIPCVLEFVPTYSVKQIDYEIDAHLLISFGEEI